MFIINIKTYSSFGARVQQPATYIIKLNFKFKTDVTVKNDSDSINLIHKTR